MPPERASPEMPGGEFDYESIPVGYYDEIYHRGRGIQSKWHHLKFEHIRQRLPDTTRHLDIGCGPGTFIGTIREQGMFVGVDISRAQIRYAQSRYSTQDHSFLPIAAGRLPFADGSFDSVTLVELVEHLFPADAEATVREACRVLRRGGRALVSTPNYRSLWPFIEGLLNRLGAVDYSGQHINKFDRRRLFDLMHRCGFNNVSVETYQLLAPFVATVGWQAADRVARLEPRWLRSRFGLLLLAEGEKAY